MADELKPESVPPGTPSRGEAAAQPDRLKEEVAKPAAPAAKPAAAGHAAPKPPATMPITPWTGELVDRLKDRFGDQISEFGVMLGQSFMVGKSEALVSILEFLKLEADFDYLVDLTAVDYPKRAARFDVVYILYSFARNERIRVKTMVAENAKADSVVGVYATANWLEREVFDMFGIQFAGHPDMRRILLPEEWVGYPLRKEYSIIQQDERWVRENLGIESGQ